MKTFLTTCAAARTRLRGFLETHPRGVVAAALLCLAAGLVFAQHVEPGVQVKSVTLAEETPALEFIPAGPGPHPVALLAHGLTGSKETLFRYGEGLAAAGFVCYDVDQPGHGASPRTYELMDTARTLAAVARAIGPVDVFLGHSLGGFTGGEAVREGKLKVKLFIALGSAPVLGDHPPPLLQLLSDEFSPVARAWLQAQTDRRVVISPGSEHILEAWDHFLVYTAVQAACAVVRPAPPAPSLTAWRWRLAGTVLAFLGAGLLASGLPRWFPRLARHRGLLSAVFWIGTFRLTIGGTIADASLHLRFLPKQILAMAVVFLLARLAGKLGIRRWGFAALGILLVVIGVWWLKTSGGVLALKFAAFAVVLTVAYVLALILGVVLGGLAPRREPWLQADIGLAIVVGWVLFQFGEWPPMPPDAARPPVPVKLDAKLLDACVGQYQFAPVCWATNGLTVTVWRQGDQLLGHTTVKNQTGPDGEIYPASATNFFIPANERQLMKKWIVQKNAQGVVTGMLSLIAIDLGACWVELPIGEGKKITAGAAAPVPPLPWLQTSADQTHFVYAGTARPFVPWGFNYDRDDAGRLLEDYWAADWTTVAADFHEMKQLGANVVRLHLQLGRFMKSPAEPDADNLARLARVVRLAEVTGVYLDVTGLGCYHQADIPGWYTTMGEAARWQVQARCWAALAGVCQDSPAIFCYDLMNEPVPAGARRDGWLVGAPFGGSYFAQRLTTSLRGRTEAEVARAWIDALSAAIRTVDQRHMLTVGVFPWEQMFGPGAQSAFRDPAVVAPLDFLCLHYYPRQGKLTDDLAILKLYDTGKPLVIEEIFPLSAGFGTTAEFIRQSRAEAAGWLSFYWGRTPEEYDREPGFRAAQAGGWLRRFVALRQEMPVGNAPPAPL